MLDFGVLLCCIFVCVVTKVMSIVVLTVALLELNGKRRSMSLTRTVKTVEQQAVNRDSSSSSSSTEFFRGVMSSLTVNT